MYAIFLTYPNRNLTPIEPEYSDPVFSLVHENNAASQSTPNTSLSFLPKLLPSSYYASLRNPDGSLFESFGIDPAVMPIGVSTLEGYSDTDKYSHLVSLFTANRADSGSAYAMLQSHDIIVSAKASHYAYLNHTDVTRPTDVTLPGSMPTSTSTVGVLDHHVYTPYIPGIRFN